MFAAGTGNVGSPFSHAGGADVYGTGGHFRALTTLGVQTILSSCLRGLDDLAYRILAEKVKNYSTLSC
jgi:hypothetical protein